MEKVEKKERKNSKRRCSPQQNYHVLAFLIERYRKNFESFSYLGKFFEAIMSFTSASEVTNQNQSLQSLP